MPAFTEERADITGIRKRRRSMDLFIGMICIIIGAAFGVFISALMAANMDSRPTRRNANFKKRNERK